MSTGEHEVTAISDGYQCTCGFAARTHAAAERHLRDPLGVTARLPSPPPAWGPRQAQTVAVTPRPDDDGIPVDTMAEPSVKECAFCLATIPWRASVCRHCGRSCVEGAERVFAMSPIATLGKTTDGKFAIWSAAWPWERPAVFDDNEEGWIQALKAWQGLHASEQSSGFWFGLGVVLPIGS